MTDQEMDKKIEEAAREIDDYVGGQYAMPADNSEGIAEILRKHFAPQQPAEPQMRLDVLFDSIADCDRCQTDPDSDPMTCAYHSEQIMRIAAEQSEPAKRNPCADCDCWCHQAGRNMRCEKCAEVNP